MKTIDVDHAADHFQEIVQAVLAGELVILEKDDKPIAKVVSLESGVNTRHFGTAKGKVHMSDDFDDPLPEFDDYS